MLLLWSYPSLITENINNFKSCEIKRLFCILLFIFIFPRLWLTYFYVCLSSYLFHSGNQEHPGDILLNTTVEVLPLKVRLCFPLSFLWERILIDLIWGSSCLWKKILVIAGPWWWVILTLFGTVKYLVYCPVCLIHRKSLDFVAYWKMTWTFVLGK